MVRATILRKSKHWKTLHDFNGKDLCVGRFGNKWSLNDYLLIRRWETVTKPEETSVEVKEGPDDCVSFFLFLKFGCGDLQSPGKPLGGFPASFRKWESGLLSTQLWACRERDSCHRPLVIFEYRIELRWKYDKPFYINWFWNNVLIQTQCLYQNKPRQTKTKQNTYKTTDPQLNVFSFIETTTAKKKNAFLPFHRDLSKQA